VPEDSRQQTTDSRGSTPKHAFRNLASWQKAQDLTDAVLDVVGGMPSSRANGILVQQIVKSSSSIGANICEGHGRFSTGAYRHLSIARGSANETIGWLDILKRREFITPERHDELVDARDEILRMISAQMIRLDRCNPPQLNRRSKPKEASA
jgi:four helix bundle protein